MTSMSGTVKQGGRVATLYRQVANTNSHVMQRALNCALIAYGFERRGHGRVRQKSGSSLVRVLCRVDWLFRLLWQRRQGYLSFKEKQLRT